MVGKKENSEYVKLIAVKYEWPQAWEHSRELRNYFVINVIQISGKIYWESLAGIFKCANVSGLPNVNIMVYRFANDFP